MGKSDMNISIDKNNYLDLYNNHGVDAPFCPSYLFRFKFCWTLGLEPILCLFHLSSL